MIAQGAIVADSAAAAVSSAGAVITMLANGPAVDSALFGAEGAAPDIAAGALVIDMSLAPPDLARAHAKQFAARRIDYLDAPISGGTIGAEQGALAHGERAPPPRSNVPRRSLLPSAVRSWLAPAGGADPVAVRQAIRGGFADSRVLELHSNRMILWDFIPGGPADHQVKDCATIVATAEAAGLNLPFVETALTLFRDLVSPMAAPDRLPAG